MIDCTSWMTWATAIAVTNSQSYPVLSHIIRLRNNNNMWTELLENAITIESIFKDEVPQLNEVVVKVVEFNYNGPTAKVVIDLNHYPEKPPKRWLLNGYNKVSMTLQLVRLHSVNITKWSTSNVCSIEIEEKSGSEKSVSITGDCNLEIRCSWISVEQINGYVDTV